MSVSDFLFEPSSRRQDQRAWTFGRRHGRCLARLLSNDQAYTLDLNAHSGVVVGLPWEGVSRSLDRIAANAIQQGWKVILFDPLGTQANADAFTSLFQQYTQKDALVCRRYVSASSSRTQLPPAYTSLAERDKRKLLDAQTYADGIYLGFDVWQRPEQAILEARALLRLLLASLDARPDELRVLVLMKHPELLFEAHEIAPLFSFFEERGGSLFIAIRSLGDFGREAQRVLKNAQTLITHRCPTSLPFEQYVNPTWWQRHDLEESIRVLPDDECFVLHRGACTRVRVCPTQRKHRRFSSKCVRSKTLTNEYLSREATEVGDEEGSDLDHILTSLFGPKRTEREEMDDDDDLILASIFGSERTEEEECDEFIFPFSVFDTFTARSLRDHLRLFYALSLLGRLHR